MPSLITYDTIRRAMGWQSMTADEIDALQTILIPGAQAELETITHRTFDVTDYTDEEHLLDYGEHAVHLLHAPVLSVSALTLDSYPANDPLTMHFAVDARDYVVRHWGIELLGYLGTTIPQVMRATYQAGFGAPHRAYKTAQAILTARVKRDLEDMKRTQSKRARDAEGVQSLSVEGYSVTYGSRGDISGLVVDPDEMGGFTSSEVRLLRALRRVVVR